MEEFDQGAVMGISLGVVITLIFAVIYNVYATEASINQLGSAICEQEYDSYFADYKDGVLYCVPKEEPETYDGLVVSVSKPIPSNS